MMRNRRILVSISMVVPILLAHTRVMADTPPPTTDPSSQFITSSRGGIDDKSPLSLAIGDLTNTPSLLSVSGRAINAFVENGATDIPLSLAQLKALERALKRLPVGLIFVGGQARTGEGRPFYAQDLAYSDGPRGFDVGYRQVFFDNQVGTVYNVRKDVSTLRQKYVDTIYRLHRELNTERKFASFNTPMDFISYLTNVLIKIQNKDPKFSKDMIDSQVRDISSNKDGIIAGVEKIDSGYALLLRHIHSDTMMLGDLFRELAVSNRVAVIAGYRHFSTAEYWNAGVSASTLILPHGNSKDLIPGQSGIYGSADVQYTGGHYRTTSALTVSQSAVRGSLSLYWQDVVPSIDTSDPNKLKVWRWTSQIGAQLFLPNGIDRNLGYDLFFRHRWLPNDYEATISVGQDSNEQVFVSLSIGRSFSIKY